MTPELLGQEIYASAEKDGTIARTFVSKGVHGTIVRIEYQFLANNNRKNSHVCKFEYTSLPVSDCRFGGGTVFRLRIRSRDHRHKP